MPETGNEAIGPILEEVAAYDREARLVVWDGPRYRMNVRVLGEGPALVVVPGIASTYRGYAMVARRLANSFKTVVYDYPGENPDDGAVLGRISHADLVDDLIGLLDQLGIRQAYPFGLSFGTTVVLSALLKAPERFPRSALQGAFSHRRLTMPEKMALKIGRRFRGSADRLPMHKAVLRVFSRDQFGQVPADRWTCYLEQNGLTSIKGLARRVELLATLDLRPDLGKIDSEILLVHGDRDTIVPRGRFEELKAVLPQASSVLLPGVGHQPHFTHPELLADLLRDFFPDQDKVGWPNPSLNKDSLKRR